MSHDLQERVARAIWAERQRHAATTYPDMLPLEDYDHPEAFAVRNNILGEARVAIEAMADMPQIMVGNIHPDLVHVTRALVALRYARHPGVPRAIGPEDLEDVLVVMSALSRIEPSDKVLQQMRHDLFNMPPEVRAWYYSVILRAMVLEFGA